MLDILQQAHQVTVAAKKSGALIPIDTDFCTIADSGIDFVVRIAKIWTVKSSRLLLRQPHMQ